MKAGARVLSAVCDTEVVVIRAADVELCCGGVPMVTERSQGVGPIAPGSGAARAAGNAAPGE